MSISDRNKINSVVMDLVVRVLGGASEYITALAYKDLPTADLMQEWGDAVQYNPDIIKIKVQLGSSSTHPPSIQKTAMRGYCEPECRIQSSINPSP